ncbi:leucine-rich repeat domain-containing protein [Stutzerimonas marianensis]
MTIERAGHFLVDVDLAGRVSVGIETDQLQACVQEAKNKKADGVFGSPSFGFMQDNLDFLSELPKLTKIWFWDVRLRDVTGVYELSALKHFGIHPKRPGIDFSRLRAIEELVWEFNEKDSGLEALSELKMLHIWHFKPKSESFAGLSVSTSVKQLHINWANPRSLDGLPALPSLQRLEIHHCRNLETVDALVDIAPNIEHLVVSACGKISGADAVIKKLPKLKHAYVQNKLLVSSEIA